MPAGIRPQCFLFTGSPRFTRDDKGTKWIILHSLTTPGFAHPSNGGELNTFPSWGKLPFTTDWAAAPVLSRSGFPSAEGWHDTGPRENAIFVGGWGGLVYHPKLRQRVTRVTSNSTAVIAKERETLEPLSYDGGNPVQYACGHSPAVLFYLLDRHAPLAMTKGTKWTIPQSLTTPAASRPPPPMERNLIRSHRGIKSPFTTDGATTPVPSQNKVPHLAEGWHAPACRGGLMPTAQEWKGLQYFVASVARTPTAPGPAQT